MSFKFGFPNWIQTQENILKPRIDLVDGSYELFTWAHVVFRQLENTVLIIKTEYKMKINLPSRRFFSQMWQPPQRFGTRFVSGVPVLQTTPSRRTAGIRSPQERGIKSPQDDNPANNMIVGRMKKASFGA